MKRIFWLGLGVALGVAAVRKLSETRAALGPQGLNRAVGSLGDSIHHFADTFRESMAEREADLRGALGIDTGIDADSRGTDSRDAGTGRDSAYRR